MHAHRDVQPPLVCQALLGLANWIVPAGSRSLWRRQWIVSLWNWWMLVERGDISIHAYPMMARHCWAALAEAVRLRVREGRMHRFIYGPGIVLAVEAAALALVAVASQGFRHTRAMVHLARTYDMSAPRVTLYDPSADLLVVHAVPIVFALVTGIILLMIERSSLHRGGWRYWSFLLAKVLGIVITLPLAWVEGGAALRALLTMELARMYAGGILVTAVFIALFGMALVWCARDQRRRCPECLQRLAMPVSMGSWASVLDPPVTEMLCENGHGSLSMLDADATAPDRWVTMDASWRDLFAH